MRSIRAKSLCWAQLRRVACVKVSHDDFERAVRTPQAKPSGPTRRYNKPVKVQELVEKILPDHNADICGLRRAVGPPTATARRR